MCVCVCFLSPRLPRKKKRMLVCFVNFGISSVGAHQPSLHKCDLSSASPTTTLLHGLLLVYCADLCSSSSLCLRLFLGYSKVLHCPLIRCQSMKAWTTKVASKANTTFKQFNHNAQWPHSSVSSPFQFSFSIDPFRLSRCRTETTNQSRLQSSTTPPK